MSAKKTKQRKEKKVDFFYFEEKGTKLKKLDKRLFPVFFVIGEIQILLKKVGSLYISKTNPKNIRHFMRKGGTFLRFP